MSKTCPLSTAVEFKACACALLDVFHMVVGKRGTAWLSLSPRGKDWQGMTGHLRPLDHRLGA